MVQLYLFSIVLWAIMIYGTVWIFEDKIKANGWFNAQNNKKNPWVTLFFMSAIPLLRVLFFVSAIIMVGMTKEKFDKWLEEYKNESN